MRHTFVEDNDMCGVTSPYTRRRVSDSSCRLSELSVRDPHYCFPWRLT